MTWDAVRGVNPFDVLPTKPKVVCLCGSTRFHATFDEQNYRETLKGHIVLSIGCVTSSDVGLGISESTKEMLDELHLRKIDLADEILVLDVDGYIGRSTTREIEYARRQGKLVRYYTEENNVGSNTASR